MAQTLPFRRDNRTASPAHARGLPRWALLLLIAPGTLLAAFVIGGDALGAVLQTALNVIWSICVLLPAAMLGLWITRPLLKRELFKRFAWPDLMRLVIATALGLGVFSLLMLLFGQCGWLRHGIPALIPLVAAIVGYVPTRHFLGALDRRPFCAPATRSDFILLAACVPLAVLLIAATFPPGSLWISEGRGYDVLEYHLQLPRQFLQNNSAAPVHGNIYSWLPLNTEMLYLMIAATARAAIGRGYLYATVYASQFLHAIITLLAAVAAALAPIPLRRLGRIVIFLLIIGTPWTLVIGSLAYNDGSVLLYGALALGAALILEDVPGAVLCGALVGLAVGTKMTAGVMVAIPVAAVLALRLRWRTLAIVTLVAAALYLPWAMRSIVYSHTAGELGNPVFPIAAQTLGMDHWSKSLAVRFDRGHAAPKRYRSPPTRFIALWRQLFLNGQWSPNIARLRLWFTGEAFGGASAPWYMRFGVLWLVLVPAVMAALIKSLRRDRAPPGPDESTTTADDARPGRAGVRSPAILLIAFMAAQILCWMLFTQLQSRFLLPIIIPLALLVGLACDVGKKTTTVAKQTGIAAWPALVSGAAVAQAGLCVFLLLTEGGLFLGPRDHARPPIGETLRLPDELISANHPIHFPRGFTTYMEGDSRCLFMHGRVIYNTVFNRNGLARALAAGGPAAGVRYLRGRHVNLLLVNWAEVHRLRNTYGFNPIITRAEIRRMIPYGLRPAPWRTPFYIRMYLVRPRSAAASE